MQCVSLNFVNILPTCQLDVTYVMNEYLYLQQQVQKEGKCNVEYEVDWIFISSSTLHACLVTLDCDEKLASFVHFGTIS